MNVLGKLQNNSFDILGIEETQTSLVRNRDQVRLSYAHAGKIIKFQKTNQSHTPQPGPFVVVKDGALLATHDRHGKHIVGKLLNWIPDTVTSKTVQGVKYYLIPVQIF